MYPFVTLGTLWLAAPFAGYFYQKKSTGFATSLMLWSGILLAWYYLMGALGYKAMGEEGDYNAWTVVWWMLNFLVFQALRLPSHPARTILIAPLLLFICGVCLWVALLVISYQLLDIG